MSTREHESPDLFEMLARLVEGSDHEGLVARCQEHAQEIRTSYPKWTQVPSEIRSDPAAVQRYANTLITVAKTFAQLGEPSLLGLLTGPSDSNPITKWQQALQGAQEAMGANDHQGASEQLQAALARAEGLTGSGAEQLRAITIGLLGQTCFHRGEVSTAVGHFEDALARCTAQGDAPGQAVYLAALFEAYRWLDQRSLAATFALRLAEHHQRRDPGQAQHWRDRATTVASEPRVRTWVEIDGARLDPDALPPNFSPEGSVRFVFERDRLGLGAVTPWLERGRQRGGARDFEEALACFAEAARIDPHDPQPEYLRGQTLLHLRRFAEAAQAYERTEALAPGWYHCRTDGWLAEQIEAGEVSTEAFELLIALESGSPEPELLELATQAAGAWPQLAPLRLAEARVLMGAGRSDEAVNAARAGLAAAREPDVETRLLVQLAQLVEPPERIALLRRAVELGGSRVARAMAQVMLHTASGDGADSGGSER